MMKKIFTVFFLTILASFLFAELDFCDRTVLVVLEPSFSEYTGTRDASFFGSFEKDSVENIFQIHNQAAINVLEESGVEFRSIYLITLPTHDKTKVLEAIEELKTIDGIEYATPNHVFTLTKEPNDLYYLDDMLWGLNGTSGIKAPDAWDFTTGSSNVRVGVIDTGISDHNDLNENTAQGKNFNYNMVPFDPDDTTDTHGHGSHVSGTIGAVGNNRLGVVGINWNISLVPLNVGEYIEENMVVSAIEYSAKLWGTDEQISVLNLSLSQYGKSIAVKSAINNYPGLFIWSAGNGIVDVDSLRYIHEFDLPNLIAVGATDITGERWEFSHYSSSNQYVHIYAPGVDIFSTYLNNGYYTWSGTSMAAPHVTGVSALLLSVDPTLNAAELKTIITTHYDPIQITLPGGIIQIVKKLNAFKAVSSILPNEIVITPDDCLKTALNHLSPGGTIYLMSGIYDQCGQCSLSEPYYLSNKDIFLIGDEHYPSIITRRLVLSNVSSETVIQNITFIPDDSQAPLGIGIELINSTPTLDNLTFIMETDFETIGIYANLTNGNNNTLNITNSKFFSNGQDIVVESIIPYHLYLERNIFSSSGLLGSTTPNTRISLINSPNIAGSTVRLINNTEIRGEQDVHATRFIEHNVDLLAKNNLFTGAIYSDRPSATNEIYYSWFVNPNQQNFPPNAITDYIYYGDPEIDEETFQPLWTETAKSGLIDAGDPDTNGNSVPWWEDPEDQDPDGSRLDIGAVPTIPHGYIQHSFKPLQVSKNNTHGGYNWVSFPYMDKLFQGDIDGRPADELHYNLHEYNENYLLLTGDDRILDYIDWRYNTEEGPVGFDNNGDLEGETSHILDSRHGYKVKMLPNMERDIIVSGFLAGLVGNPDTLMTILPDIHTVHTEIWVGYFKEQSECPLYALQDIEPWLISIQTQRWAIGRRANNGPWMTAAINPQLNFGEAVVLVAENHPELTFTWKISETATKERYEHPMAIFFEYEEQIDYVPIYVHLPEEMSIEGIGEIGMFVNSICVGAEPITGDIVQINAYILGMDIDDADIKFQFFEYGSRSGARNIENYLVFDTELQIFQTKSIDLNNGDRFYEVSFKEGDVHIPEIPKKTFLEGNFPNPFNPFTTIRYHLSQQENVSLRIYNIRGQLVKTLVNEIQEAGVYSVVWEGDNARGYSVASGVYFYRFETSVGVEVQRMVLLK
ncbi:MAG: S8 family serine peptidase [Candidatus Cloacimonetes bacterium]|nr:S8 family serine peptidase [Candidatus Cloacimonadota bacterium]